MSLCLNYLLPLIESGLGGSEKGGWLPSFQDSMNRPSPNSILLGLRIHAGQLRGMYLFVLGFSIHPDSPDERSISLYPRIFRILLRGQVRIPAL